MQLLMVMLLGLLLALFSAQQGYHAWSGYQTSVLAYQQEQFLKLAEGGMVYALQLLEQQEVVRDALKGVGSYFVEHAIPMKYAAHCDATHRDALHHNAVVAITYTMLIKSNSVQILVVVMLGGKPRSSLERTYVRK